ncbi:Protein Largen [Labeo rohita]|uniref:Protein Largen n=3 Tax=Labeo rohita TaxID=84645 RepID=A0ABQ8MYT0_LABRO|nr:Protein Largen [Labeo rohita]
MHSENSRFPTPYCQLCLRRTLGPADGPCPRMESGVAPFPKELGTERAERIGTSPAQPVSSEEIRHPCHRWDSPCVREIRRECGCIQRWYYPELMHPFNADRVLKVRGHRCYSSYVQERDNVCQPEYNGHCERRRVSFRHHEERSEHCNGMSSGQQAAFFPTEVPSSKLGRSRSLQVNGTQADVRTSRGDAGLEKHGKRRNSQGTVREQIKQVVTELEEVLGGLKQVQLEMKEVVQQIDILTSNIDLGEDEPSLSNGLSQDATKSSRTGVVALIHNSNSEEDVTTSNSSLINSPVTVDLARINGPSPTRTRTSPSPPEQRSVTVEDKGKRVVKQSSETQRTPRTANGNCLPHRTARKGQLENHKPPVAPVVCTNSNKTHRPPPYPQNGQVKMRTPPYAGKHKMLSSTVV